MRHKQTSLEIHTPTKECVIGNEEFAEVDLQYWTNQDPCTASLLLFYRVEEVCRSQHIAQLNILHSIC